MAVQASDPGVLPGGRPYCVFLNPILSISTSIQEISLRTHFPELGWAARWTPAILLAHAERWQSGRMRRLAKAVSP